MLQKQKTASLDGFWLYLSAYYALFEDFFCTSWANIQTDAEEHWWT